MMAISTQVFDDAQLADLAAAFEGRLSFEEAPTGSFYPLNDNYPGLNIQHTDTPFFYDVANTRVSFGDRFVGQDVDYVVRDAFEVFDRLVGNPVGGLQLSPTAAGNQGLSLYLGRVSGRSAPTPASDTNRDIFSIGEGSIAVQFSRPVVDLLLTLSVDDIANTWVRFAFYGAQGQVIGSTVVNQGAGDDRDRMPVRFGFSEPVSGFTVENGEGEGMELNDLWFTPLNLPPVVPNKGFDVLEDQPLTLTFADLLAGAADPEGGPVVLDPATIGQPVGGGLVQVDAAAQTVTFVPGQNFNGPTSFGFGVRDAQGNLATATAGINVMPVNDAPVVPGKTFGTLEDMALTVTFADLLAGASDVDGGALAIDPSRFVATGDGSLSVDTTAQTVTWTPAVNFNGTASFGFGVSDGQGGVTDATALVGVTPVNDAPVGVADVLNPTQRYNVEIPLSQLLANDTDVDGDLLSVTGWGPTADGGVLTLNADGTALVYTAGIDTDGVDSFTYTLSDGAGGTSSASVTLNLPPEANNLVMVEDLWGGGDRDYDDMVAQLEGLRMDPSQRGTFVVESDEIAVRFLFDGGGYRSELGVFSLAGLDGLDTTSDAYRQEVLNRVKSNGELGGIVLSDVRQGAKFTRLRLNDGSMNGGQYLGRRLFDGMDPGDRVGLALMRDSRFGNTTTVGKQDMFLSVDGASVDGIDHFAYVTQAMGLYAPPNSRLGWANDNGFAQILDSVDLSLVAA